MSPDPTRRAPLEVFAMERLQSIWENRVEWNVSESGVHPLRVEELVDDPAALAALMSQPLGYPQTNGTVELRSAIASMYPGAINDRLARIALAPARREHLLARTRSILRANYPILRDWVAARTPLLSHVAPEAGAIAFVRYHHAINSTRLIERLRDEHSVLVVPGDHFDMDGYLRIGFGSDPAHLSGSLERIGALLDTIPAAADAR